MRSSGKRRRAGDLRQAAGGGAAHQVHLEQPVARVHEAERGGGIGGVAAWMRGMPSASKPISTGPDRPGIARLLRARRQGQPQHAVTRAATSSTRKPRPRQQAADQPERICAWHQGAGAASRRKVNAGRWAADRGTRFRWRHTIRESGDRREAVEDQPSVAWPAGDPTLGFGYTRCIDADSGLGMRDGQPRPSVAGPLRTSRSRQCPGRRARKRSGQAGSIRSPFAAVCSAPRGRRRAVSCTVR